MSKAQQLINSPDFNALPIEMQNRLLIDVLTQPVSVEPIQDPASVSQTVPSHVYADQGVIMHMNGQPFFVAPMASDPTAGISSNPISLPPAQPKFTGTDAAKATLGNVGDTLKTGLGLLLGTAGLIGNLAVDVVTLGQSKGDIKQVQAQLPTGVAK